MTEKNELKPKSLPVNRIIKIFKVALWGNNNIEIKEAFSKNAEGEEVEVYYFKCLHPFYTRQEVNRLMSAFYGHYCQPTTKIRKMIFDEKPSFLQKIKDFIGKKISISIK